MIISIYAERAFDKVKHTFIIKKLKLCREEMYLHIKKAIYDKPTANVTLNGKKLKVFL